MIIKQGKVPLARRQGAHGQGEWAFPGGHLEYGESFAQCARREVKEETGMLIKNIGFQFLAKVKKYGGKHYVHVGLIADWKSGEAKRLEVDKAGEWQWFPIAQFPKPTFEFCRLAAISYQNGKNYFDL